jgi:perosamine synthetase
MSSDALIGTYPPLEPSTLVGRPHRDAFPWSEPGLALTHLGRGAVWLALEALGLGPGRRIAMPAYHCGSEVEAVRLAGVEPVWYRVDAELRVDLDELDRAAREAGAAYLVSHFGFPMPPPPQGVPVIEDAAHGLFSLDPEGRPLGARGQAAVFCPRKSLGVPDGGAVLVAGGAAAARERRPGARAMVRSALSLAAGRAAISRLGPLRRGAAGLIGRTSRGDAAAREGLLTETVIGEWDLEAADMEAAAGRPARLTELSVRRADPERTRARRRRNYELLAGELAELAPAPYRRLPAGTAPLYFPALAADREAAIAGLLEHGVRPLEVWPVPHPLLPRRRYPELEPARTGLLALPVHQALGEWHMERVLSAARRVLLGR